MKGDVCSIEGCWKVITEPRSVCNSCRMRKRRTGSYDDLPLTREQKFWSRVKKLDSCWIWIGHLSSTGYGIMTTKRSIRAHRFSWQLHYGDIPKGIHVCHTCDVRRCVNPDHLFLGTHQDNMNDMIRKGRLVDISKTGEDHPFAKLTENKVKKIKNLLKRGETCISISQQYNVSASVISSIKRNKTWRHVDVD